MSKNSQYTRRNFLVAGTAVAAALLVGKRSAAAQGRDHRSSEPLQPGKLTFPAGVPREIVVYKDANCGCCKEWVKHMSAAGFTVTANDTNMDVVRASMGVPEKLQSCHTGKIGNYLVEGHVPADLVLRMLVEKPVARGLTIPGMPMSAPGMDQPGAPKQKYTVLLFDKAGNSKVYATR